MKRRTLGLTLAGAAAVVLGTGSTVVLHAMTQGSDPFSPTSTSDDHQAGSCVAPSLPGSVTHIALTDMGAPMGRSVSSGHHRMDGRGIWTGGMGATGHMGGGMAITVGQSSVHSGTVSFVVANRGSIAHELVVLPLTDAARSGQRAVSSDDRVSETGSVGEASTTCGAGAGEGITAGTQGWVTLDLKPGRYELVCNLEGHYAAGMHAELDVTA